MANNNNDLNFAVKNSGGSRTQNTIDVSVTMIDSRTNVAFSMSQKAVAMLGNAEYITAAKSGSKLYFKPCGVKYGFKLSGKPEQGRKMVRIPAGQLSMAHENWIGYYRLLWDKERELFYIDANLRGE